MDYNKVWFLRSTFHEQAKKKPQGFLFGQCRSKTQILFKINTLNVFLEVFRNPKILQKSCHILSQYGAS